MKKRNMVTTTYPNIFSKTLYFVHNKNGSVTHRSYFERVGYLNPENLAPINLANMSHQKKILNLILKKREDFFKYLFKSDKCLINNTVINV